MNEFISHIAIATFSFTPRIQKYKPQLLTGKKIITSKQRALIFISGERLNVKF